MFDSSKTSTTTPVKIAPPSARPTHDYRRVATIGIGIIVGTFGVLGLWAAVAPLNSAVVAHGTVAVQSSRQTVQHLEGGIIAKILIHEGDHVHVGQSLFQLDPVQTQASVSISRNQLFTLLARRDRLSAERDGRSVLIFSPEIQAQSANPDVAQAMTDEQRQFLERRATINSQIAVLNTRISEYRTEMQGMATERASMEQQVGYLDDEISGLTELYRQNLVPKPRLLALQRERAQLQGQIGRSVSDRARTEKSIGETTLQMRQLQQQFNQDVSKELADVQQQSADVRQKFTVAQDQMQRMEVKAPMSGTVQNLRFFTQGAVVRPGEPMVDIAPDTGEMIVQTHISPNDIDSVHAGQKVEVRFSTFHSRTIPVISGLVKTVSQDRLVDEATHTPYYLSIVEVPPSQMPTELRGKLRAGMPADVMIPTGSRTALQYIWQPLTNALNQTMREK
jgi:HlyD family type I secretion membrane fusion protein